MSENITDRLRCRYALGPIMPNGEPEFGWRDFSGPAIDGMTLPTPLMLEAAEAIAARDAEIERLREALSELVACRDIKRRIAIEQATMIPETDDDFAELDRLMTDLANRQPKAWAAAEVALAQEQGGSDD